MLPIALLTGLLSLIVVFTGTGLVAAGAAAATFDELSSGLPDVARFEQLTFAQPTVVYDRTGTVELARFQAERRNVVTFEEIPQLVLDATIAVEDRTFWTNQGYDPSAIAAAAAEALQTGSLRGASTITQQFVRAPEVGLLPADILAPGADARVRKAKEIIQAGRLTEYVTDGYGAEDGKKRIITAYLNQINYGHNSYGISAAADIYFGKPLSELTVSEAALLAGLPQAPAVYDLYRFAQPDASGRLVVPSCGSDPAEGCEDVAPVARRNYILVQGLAQGYGRWTTLTEAQLKAALDEPIVLAGDRPLVYKAPHFVWAMKAQLDQLLSDRAPATTGGYKVITTLDMRAQELGERYIEAATIMPRLQGGALDDAIDQAIRERRLKRADRAWIEVLQGRNVNNGALTAIDYRTGDVLSYVGSAGYYRDDLASKQFDPKVDVAASYRQPGSAFKPVMYATAFEERVLTPGSLLLDVTTSFGSRWQPKNADLLERGPVRVRQALQYSLNLPAIRAMQRVGPRPVEEAAQRAGLTFLGGPNAIEQAGLAAAIGTVEVRLVELASTYGAFGNDGLVAQPRMILKVTDDADNLVYDAGAPMTRQVWSPQAAWLVGDILKDNTNRSANLVWGPLFETFNGPDGAYRPLMLKTGTTNDVRDLSAYGIAAQPDDPTKPAISVGVWMGNSDHTSPSGNAELFGSDGPARVWQAFMREYLDNEPVADFKRPDRGLVEETIDAWSGGRPGEWTRDSLREWFISGTQPDARNPVDQAGLLYREACGGQWFVDPVKAERDGVPDQWRQDVADWEARARRGPSTRSAQYGTNTAYFWGKSSWGGPIIPADTNACNTPSPSLPTFGTPEPSAGPTQEPGRTRPPDRTPRPNPTAEPTATPDPEPTATPDPEPTKDPCDRPNPSRGCNQTPGPSPTEDADVGDFGSTDALAGASSGGQAGAIGKTDGLDPNGGDRPTDGATRLPVADRNGGFDTRLRRLGRRRLRGRSGATINRSNSSMEVSHGH